MVESAVQSPAEIVVGSPEKKQIRILLVDDDQGLQKVTKQCLEMQGMFAVDTVSSVNEALEILKKTGYSAVVSDFQMPGKDGLEFLKELRADGNDIPFMIFTGKGREEVAIEALNLGADQYLNKHGDPETVYCELAHAIRKAVERRSSQLELSRREAKLNAILESSPEAITISGLDGNIVECNQAAVDLHCCQSKKGLIGRNAFELISKKDLEKATQNLKKTIEQGPVKTVEYTLLTEDGREFSGELSASVVRDASGKPDCFVAITKDITERNQVKKTLQESEEKYRRLVENLHEGVWAIDKDSFTTFANSRMAEILGYTVKEMLGKPLFAFMDERGIEIAKRLLERRPQGIKEQHDFEFIRKDGSRIYATLETSQINDNNGNYIGALAGVMDVTDRKKAEAALRESERKFRTLFDNANDALIYLDSSGSILDVNRKTVEIFGGTKEEIIGKQFTEIGIFSVKETSELMHNFASILAGNMANVYVRFTNMRGQQIDLECSISLAKLDEAPAMVIVARDISERKKAERELLIKENAMASSVEGIAIADLQGNLTYVNSAFSKMWGYDSDKEIVGKSIVEMTQKGQSKEKADEIVETLRTNGWWTGDITATRKDGSKFCASLSANMVKDETGKPICMLSSFVDITERKRAEAELRRLATIVIDSNDAITVVDLNGRITAWNKGAQNIYGYGKDEALGMDILKIVPEDKKQETLDLIGKIKNNEVVESLETKRLAKDGRVLDIWLTVTKLVDDKGNIVAVVKTERDITEKKRLEEKLRLSEKFTILGQLASSVAHEIRNPLGVIKNSVYFLNVRLEEHADEKVTKHLKIMERNISSADCIISNLLDLGRNKVGPLEPVDLNVILEQAFMNLSIPEDVKVIKKLDKIPKMLLDPVGIQRVFVNIIQNAFAAMPKGGKLAVGISRSGDSAEISFKDSGVGISEEGMQKLFTPMFTTKAKGLGLGLAICRQIVEGHNGHIAVRSKVGEGALFTVRLPISHEAKPVKAGPLHADMRFWEVNK